MGLGDTTGYPSIVPIPAVCPLAGEKPAHLGREDVTGVNPEACGYGCLGN